MPFVVNKTTRSSCVDALKKFDSNIYFSHNYDKIYSCVCTHPDVQIHFVSENTAYVPPELFGYYKNILPSYIDLRKGEKSLGGTYPFDVAYNVARIGKYVVLNAKYADRKIISYYKDKNYKFINVNQGYAKCNICTNGEVAVTEDEGIYSALVKNGIKTLKIPCGSVRLEGFDYGFIGGASGCFKDKMLFYGKINNKEIWSRIKTFFGENGTKILSLDNEELTDYGSIIYFE